MGCESPRVSGLLAVFGIRAWFCPFQGRYEVPLVGERLLFGSRELVVGVGGDAPHTGADIEYRVLENTSAGAGTCSGTLPPYGATLGKRLGYIRNHLQQNEKYWDNKADKEWREASETLVREMRKAWERAIEEVLFNDAVTRFERAVQTNRVRTVTVDDSDWTAIENAMTELSRLGPHDEPQEAQDEPPTPADIKALIQDLEDWRLGVAQKRKATDKRRPKVTAKI